MFHSNINERSSKRVAAVSELQYNDALTSEL